MAGGPERNGEVIKIDGHRPEIVEGLIRVAHATQVFEYPRILHETDIVTDNDLRLRIYPVNRVTVIVEVSQREKTGRVSIEEVAFYPNAKDPLTAVLMDAKQKLIINEGYLFTRPVKGK